MKKEDTIIETISFVQLSSDAALSSANYTELADLIYDTDPYIYPAMFGSRENAAAVLPQLFSSQDTMFRVENCFTAFLGNRIVGLLLWVSGQLFWSPEPLKLAAERLGIPVSPYLEAVAREYVGRYAEREANDLISVVNVCVSADMRGMGIATELLKRFIVKHPWCAMELCVLKSNRQAIRLYRSAGFEVVGEYNGFSSDNRCLPAACMRREGSW